MAEVKRADLIDGLGLSESDWKIQLGILGIEDKDVYEEGEAGMIRVSAASAASVASNGNGNGKSGKSKGKAKELAAASGESGGASKLMNRAEAQEVTAVDAGSLGEALARQAVAAQQSGETLADGVLAALANGFTGRMTAGVQEFGRQAPNFLDRLLELDAEVERQESRPVAELMANLLPGKE